LRNPGNNVLAAVSLAHHIFSLTERHN